MEQQFFLGANTPQGFASYYDDWLDLNRINRLFIIKGTPGNGKSSFMKRIAAKLKDKGYLYETILCSGDVRSWDGVYFPKLGVAIADGTSPHVIEPKLPLAVEAYLPLTQLIDDSAICLSRTEIGALQSGMKEDYARLYRILSAVKSLQDEQYAIVYDPAAHENIRRRTRGIIRREIRKGKGGAVHKRFLNAISPDGEVILWDTVNGMADRVYELKDSYRQAHTMLAPLMAAALEAGQEVYACYDTYAPAVRLAHLILPGLRLAFVSSGARDAYPGEPYRRIRLDACAPRELVRGSRLRLRFLRKTEEALKQDAADLQKEISVKHDALEAVYNPHVDFIGLRALADAYTEKIILDYAKQ